MQKFDARAFERELVAAGCLPVEEYVRRWGEDKDEALSSRAEKGPYITPPSLKHPTIDGTTARFYADLHELWRRFSADITKPKANTRQRAND